MVIDTNKLIEILEEQRQNKPSVGNRFIEIYEIIHGIPIVKEFLKHCIMSNNELTAKAAFVSGIFVGIMLKEKQCQP